MMRVVLALILTGCASSQSPENVAELPEAPRCAAQPMPGRAPRSGRCPREAEHPRK